MCVTRRRKIASITVSKYGKKLCNDATRRRIQHTDIYRGNILQDTRVAIDLVPEIPEKVLTRTCTLLRIVYRRRCAMIVPPVQANRSTKLNRRRERAIERIVVSPRKLLF